jgi:hypothetical protein
MEKSLMICEMVYLGVGVDKVHKSSWELGDWGKE